MNKIGHWNTNYLKLGLGEFNSVKNDKVMSLLLQEKCFHQEIPKFKIQKNRAGNLNKLRNRR